MDTEVSLARQGTAARFGLRLMMATGESEPSYRPSVPGVVRKVSDAPGLTEYGYRLSVDPMVVASDAEVSALVRLLLNPRRRKPVYVVSLEEPDTDATTAIIDRNNWHIAAWDSLMWQWSRDRWPSVCPTILESNFRCSDEQCVLIALA